MARFSRHLVDLSRVSVILRDFHVGWRENRATRVP